MNDTTKTAARPQSRKVRLGRVVSNRMQKTIIVQVDRLVGHRLYERVVHRASRFKVHDETNQAKIGDWVKIMETRPLSKDKRWRLVEIVKRGEAQDLEASQPATPPEAAG